MLRNLELLAPAKDATIAREAILHGADAVYIGGPSHGARASASNTIEDISALTDFAHLYGAKVYVTLNTIIYESELKQVEQNIHQLYDAGVDALIVQDMSLLRMDIPPIDLHASTQCDIRTPEKAEFLASCGFSQLVLPREFSIAEIEAVREAVGDDVVLEAFVHGALCVSYSGDCQASCIAKGRSANRGECAQMCRLPYSLIDGTGRVIVKDKHLLSLKDLNRLPDLNALVEAGVQSFKIEGRLKDAAYVKNTVSAYRRALDKIIAEKPDVYRRASWGETRITFTPDVEKSFNRGFTSYFLNGRPQGAISMANLDTPKWIGQKVGRILKVSGNTLIAKLDTALNNGDGLGYFDKGGNFTGFRLNRIEGNRLFPASEVNITPGTDIYRNRDVKTDALMSQKTAQRLIPIDITLDYQHDKLILTLSAPEIASVTVDTVISIDEARTPQKEARKRALSKLGNTPFSLNSFADYLDDSAFIAASVLSDLRQRAVAALSDKIIASHTRQTKKAEDKSVKAYAQHDKSGTQALTYHDNVANSLAEAFYRDHGVSKIERAIETQQKSDRPLQVMTTRYCIRRELGACLCDKESKKLTEPLYITNDSATYKLDFDCKNCRMHLITAKKP